MNSWFLVRVCPLKIFKNSIKTVLESSVLKSVLMLMIQILLVALAEIAEFNISFIAVINAFSIYCHRNTLKQHAGKTVDELYLRWNNNNYDSNKQCTPNYLPERYSSARYSRWYFKSCFGNIH